MQWQNVYNSLDKMMQIKAVGILQDLGRSNIIDEVSYTINYVHQKKSISERSSYALLFLSIQHFQEFL